MNIETVVVGDFEVNCYVLRGTESRCAVVDPGKDAGKILDLIRRHGLTVDAYLLTHGHFDHVSALAELHERHPAPVACHPLDWAWAFTRPNSMAPFYDVPRKPEGCVERALREGDPLRAAGLEMHIVETPGHTQGSVCLYLPGEQVVITGDTLFAGSVGRTDLPGGNARVLSSSLRKLAALPPDTRVCPGHGPETDLGTEKRVNYFMRNL